MAKYSIDYLIRGRQELWKTTGNLESDKLYIKTATKEVTENPELLQELVDYPEKFIELFFYIVNKRKKTVPFFLNTVQKHVIERINKGVADYTAGLRNSLKFRCLKGRQQGVTALITAYQLACTILHTNFSGYTMADTGDNARVILNDKGKYPYKHIPNIFKPHEKFNSANEIFFDRLNSSWRIASAESGEAGRSRTLNFFHGSETGFWDNYLGIMAALNPALTEDAIIFEESTANGHNDFHGNWFDENSDYENIFLVWWLSAEYRAKFESEEKEAEFKEAVEGEFTPFHKKLNLLRTKEGLDWNQLYWYNNKRKALKDKLEQEYPCTEEEAFLHSGRPYFDVQVLQQKLIEYKNIQPAEIRANGEIVLFEKPIPEEKYYIGADVAEGLECEDYSHAKIIKASTTEEVAFIHGHYSTDRFGHLLVQIAKEYNNAFIGVENNNHGHAVINTIYIYNSYKNLYIQHQINRIHDKKDRGKKLGWTTTEASKYLMLDELDSALREGIITIYDTDFYKECSKVLKDEKGNVSINGLDRVAATAIAYQMRKYHFKKDPIALYYQKMAEERRQRLEESGLKLVS
jgi:hypothetical protein